MKLQLCLGLSFICILLVCSSVAGPTFDEVGSPAPRDDAGDFDGMVDIIWENQDFDREGDTVDGGHGHLVEADIFEQDEVEEDEEDTTTEEGARRRVRRNALRDRKSLWPGGGIPYIIDGYFNDNHKKHILAAMQRFHEKTCIRFRPRTIERDYILFTQSAGCWSMVGRTGGRQKISLSGTCRTSRGVIMHELMHAIGFRHEHNRADRDGYINIYWANIKEGFTSNFRKYSNSQVQTLGTGYDFLSLMHYPMTAFSKDGNTVTIGSRYPTYNINEVGNRNDFSHIDIYRINSLYRCGQCEDTDPYYCPIWAMMGECQATKDWMTKYCPFSCDRCTIALANGDGLACIDRTSNCKRWAKIGECARNPEYMLQNCRRSCKQCRAVNSETGEDGDEGLSCQDDNTLCYDWATLGECDSNAKFMKQHCRRSCHVCTGGGDGRLIIDTGECRDRHPQCPTWAETTRCQVNVGYMEENCRLSCNWCPPEDECVDDSNECEKWARAGHCLTNEEGLQSACKKSCGYCGEVEECRDIHRKCRAWSKENWCSRSPRFMTKFCSPSCGLCDDNRPGNQTLIRPVQTKPKKKAKQRVTDETTDATTVGPTGALGEGETGRTGPETPLTREQIKAQKRANKKKKQAAKKAAAKAKKNKKTRPVPIREDLDMRAVEMRGK